MPIKINYSNKLTKKSLINLVLFVDEIFNIKHLKNLITQAEFLYISDLIKNSDLKKKVTNF